jgi:hypothetical protein
VQMGLPRVMSCDQRPLTPLHPSSSVGPALPVLYHRSHAATRATSLSPRSSGGQRAIPGLRSDAGTYVLLPPLARYAAKNSRRLPGLQGNRYMQVACTSRAA